MDQALQDIEHLSHDIPVQPDEAKAALFYPSAVFITFTVTFYYYYYLFFLEFLVSLSRNKVEAKDILYKDHSAKKGIELPVFSFSINIVLSRGRLFLIHFS